MKPAFEPIILARKPLAGTVAATVSQYGTGAINVDACRIGSTVETWPASRGANTRRSMAGGEMLQRDTGDAPAGRWPANVVLSHSPECREVGTRKVKGQKPGSFQREMTSRGYEGGGLGQRRADDHDAVDLAKPGYADADGYEEVPHWECAPDCAAALLDAQSGKRGGNASGTSTGALGQSSGWNAHANKERSHPGYGDTGGASRFFYTAKSSRRERESGLDGLEVVSVAYASWENEARAAQLLVATDLFPPRVIAVSGTPDNDATAWSTFLFGNGTTAPLLTATTFITATAINSITESKTLNWLARSLTSVCTVAVSGAATSGGNPAGSAVRGTPCLAITGEWTESPLGAAPVPWLTRCEIRGNAASPASHPTVKPLALMRWLCRLATPKSVTWCPLCDKSATGQFCECGTLLALEPGLILDPFTGSGSTGCAAALEGFRFTGIEQDESYCAIARRRIAHWTPVQPDLEPAA